MHLEESYLYEHFRNFDIPDNILSKNQNVSDQDFHFNIEREEQSVTYKVVLQSLFSEQTNSSSFLLIFIDQTQLAKSLREKNDFLANASHELKTPITNIVGISEILKNDPEALKTNKNFSNHLLSNSLRLKTLIENYLDLSRVEMNKNLAINQNINFHNFLKNFINEYFFNNEKKKIQVKSNINTKSILTGNKWELDLLLNNILDNSFKYSADKVSIHINEDNNFIIIKIADNGMGVSKFDLEKIKERFYRGKGSENIQGTGLGLSIVNEIINNHKGKFEINSDENKGTSVSFTLKKTP